MTRKKRIYVYRSYTILHIDAYIPIYYINHAPRLGFTPFVIKYEGSKSFFYTSFYVDGKYIQID